MDYVPRRVTEQAIRRLGRRALFDRLHALRALAAVRGLRYADDRGRVRTIDLSLKPWLLTSAQLLHFHRAMQLLAGALTRLPGLYAKDAAVRRILRFEPERAAWMQLARSPRSRPLAVVGRLDSTALYDHAGWRTAFRMLEPNAVGVGGVHYAPAACGVLLDVMGDVLAQALPGRTIGPTPDPRQLLVEELAGVARRLHRPLRSVALIENMEYTTGTDEFGRLARYLQGQGLNAIVTDPRHLQLRRGRVTHGKTTIDLVYRDCELSEFVEMEAKGKRLAALRQAVVDGQLVSGLLWEFDQKSAFEIFTDARYAKVFSPSQRRFFREHLLWTRLVREERVTDPAGRLVDLSAYIRRHKNRLVLKPNTLFGGEGVVLGHTVNQHRWERELGKALRACRPGRQARERYVVQELARIGTDIVPMLVNGKPRMESRSTVSGFFFNSTGIGLIGRFSGNPVVNVSQGGGIVSALWVH